MFVVVYNNVQYGLRNSRPVRITQIVVISLAPMVDNDLRFGVSVKM